MTNLTLSPSHAAEFVSDTISSSRVLMGIVWVRRQAAHRPDLTRVVEEANVILLLLRVMMFRREMSASTVGGKAASFGGGG
jgi:hypothetical protein